MVRINSIVVEIDVIGFPKAAEASSYNERDRRLIG